MARTLTGRADRSPTVLYSRSATASFWVIPALYASSGAISLRRRAQGPRSPLVYPDSDTSIAPRGPACQ